MLKFVHPGTIKQGYLTKSPPLKKRGLKVWKKRWCIFVVTSNQPFLKYYHNEDEAMQSLPIKRVSLSNCFKVDGDLKHSSFRNIFAIYLPERVYYFSAPSKVEMVEWVDALCSHLKLEGPDLSSTSHLSATMPSTPPTARSVLTYDTTTLYTGSLPRLPSQTSPLFSRPPPPDSPLPPIPGSTRPPPPNSPLPPIPPESSSPRLNPPRSPLLNRDFATHPPPPPPRESRLHPSLPPPPLPHAPGKVNGSTSIEDELSPPPPPRRSVSTSHDQPLSPQHEVKRLGKQFSPHTCTTNEDSPPPPPQRIFSMSKPAHPQQDETSPYELDSPGDEDESSSESFENVSSPEHEVKSEKKLFISPDEPLSPSHDENSSKKDLSTDSTDNSDTPPVPPPRPQLSPPVTNASSSPPCDIVVTS